MGILFSASLLWLLFLGSEGKVHLVVPGSCEGPQEATVGAGSFRFHCPACWEPELSVHLQVACLLICEAGRPWSLIPSFPQHLLPACLSPHPEPLNPPFIPWQSQAPWEDCGADVSLLSPFLLLLCHSQGRLLKFLLEWNGRDS